MVKCRCLPGAALAEFLQVEAAARFRAGAGEAVPAEGLHADDGADDVAVDVDVARFDLVGDARDGAVDAAVDAVGQRVAFLVDLFEQAVEFARAVAQDVQHRAEDFALEFVEVVEFEEDGRDVGGGRRVDVVCDRGFVVRAGDGFHFVDVGAQVLLGLGVNDRADVGGHGARVGDAQFVHRAFDHGEGALGDVILQAEDAQRGAALSGAVVGAVDDVQADLFGKRGAVHDHRVLAAGFGDEYRVVVARGKGAVDALGDFGRAGEDDAVDAFVLGECGARIARAEDELQHVARYARLVHELYGAVGDEAGLFGRFGDDGVADGEGGDDFAGEDGEREVPGADGDDGADRFAGGAGGFGFIRVVAAEIHGFAHFGDGVGEGFARFAHGEAHQFGGVRFKEVGDAAQDGGARGGGNGRPAVFGCFGGGDNVGDGVHFDEGGVADAVFVVRRVRDVVHCFAFDGRGGDAARLHARGGGAVHFAFELFQGEFVAEVEAARVGAARAVEGARQRQGGVHFALRLRGGCQRAFDEVVNADVFIDDLVDKGGVGTVFQQAAHEVGEQGFVRANRGVNAHAAAKVLRADDLVVEGFAHAVQALVLEVFVLAHLVDGAEGVGVVRGKLREDGVLRAEQFARAGEVGDVGMHFARVHRIAVQTIDLRPFDFAVPVGALDEANHQLLFVAPREVDEVINDKRAALLVGLHHEADAVVAGKVGVGNQRFHQIQREFEAVGFFGVDVDADIVLFAE